MKLILVSTAALVLVGGTAVCAQPQESNRRDQQSEQRDVQHGQQSRESHHWTRGQTLPSSYRTPSAYVDYRSNHLSRPHAGRRWVKVDNDNFAEMSLSTGHIYQIIPHH